MDRRKILYGMFDRSRLGLEIGPSFNPIVPKSSGARIETLDHTDQAGLIAKYSTHSHIDVSRIEPVDYVSDGRPMAQVIGATARYDYIIASHVIEHTPNLLGFLKDCEQLLAPDGVLVLAVPDKRYCFDVFQPLTSTGAILQAYREKRTRHPPGVVFDQYAYAAKRDGRISWGLGGTGELSFVHDLIAAGRFFGNAVDEGPYVDCHVWRFTPSSFRLILQDLAELGMISLLEQAFHGTLGSEFFAALSRKGSGCPIGRLALAEKVLAEMRES
jgi:hypothetical protein